MSTQFQSFEHILNAAFRRQLFASAAILLMLGTALTYHHLSNDERTQKKMLKDLGHSTGTLVSSLALPLVVFKDWEALERLTKQIEANQSRIVLVAAVAPGGQIVAATPNDYVPPALLSPTKSDTMHLDGAVVQVFSIPIEGTGSPPYTIHLGFEKQSYLENIDQTRKRSVTLTGVLILLSALVFIYLRRSMFHAAKSVTQAVSVATTELKISAANILGIARETESRAADEAAAVDQTRRTMQALVNAANEITESAEEVHRRAERSNEASADVAERIDRLNEQAMSIREISETIQSVATKSDILALNAGLEGIKIGAAGRSFVRVGAEMRRLAERVMGAVRQIKVLAKDIREMSNAAVLAADQGRELAGETSITSQRITLITNQQRSGTEQVAESMDDLQTLVQKSLEGARKSQQTAHELHNAAENLNQQIVGSSGKPRDRLRTLGDVFT